jgi:uncharacterized protein (TIGR00255 family)
MTGFARADGHDGGWTWAWELKSVNGRGLDVRCKLPPDLDGLEPTVRSHIQERFSRGTISAALTVTRPPGALKLRLNVEVAEQLEQIVRELAARVKAQPPTLDGLLSVRGVIETAEEDEAPEARASREQAFVVALDEAIAALAEARAQEGTRLGAVLASQLDELEGLADDAEACATVRPEAIRARLKEQVAALLEAAPALPEERLAQEAALLAAKADLREELDRLRAHLAAARELLSASGPVGRRLDFLCQELNREANTICSKSTDIELTRIGLDLKAGIEQFREQIHNIE